MELQTVPVREVFYEAGLIGDRWQMSPMQKHRVRGDFVKPTLNKLLSKNAWWRDSWVETLVTVV